MGETSGVSYPLRHNRHYSDAERADRRRAGGETGVRFATWGSVQHDGRTSFAIGG